MSRKNLLFICVLAILIATYFITLFFVNHRVNTAFEALSAYLNSSSPYISGQWSYHPHTFGPTAHSSFYFVLPDAAHLTAVTVRTEYTFDTIPSLRKLANRAWAHFTAVSSLSFPLKPDLTIDYTTHGVYGFDRTIRLHTDIPAHDLTFPIEDALLTLSTDAISLSHVMSDDMHTVISDFLIPRMHVTLDTVNLDATLHNAAIHSDFVYIVFPDLAIGSVSLQLERLAMSARTPDEAVFLSNLYIAGNTDLIDDTMSTFGTLSLEAVSIEDEVYGPLNVSYTVENICTNVMTQFSRVARELSRETAFDHTEILAEMLALLPAFLEKKPGIRDADISIVTPEGTFNASLSLAWKGPGNIDFSILEAMGPLGALMLLPHIEAHLTVRVDEGLLPPESVTVQGLDEDVLAEMPPEMRELFPAEQTFNPRDALFPLPFDMLFIEDNGAYTLEFMLQNGAILLNGEPLPLQ